MKYSFGPFIDSEFIKIDNEPKGRNTFGIFIYSEVYMNLCMIEDTNEMDLKCIFNL
jgi:hypothetical protein